MNGKMKTAKILLLFLIPVFLIFVIISASLYMIAERSAAEVENVSVTVISSSAHSGGSSDDSLDVRVLLDGKEYELLGVRKNQLSVYAAGKTVDAYLLDGKLYSSQSGAVGSTGDHRVYSFLFGITYLLAFAILGVAVFYIQYKIKIKQNAQNTP